MTTQTFPSLSTELAHRVEAFEAALTTDPAADFATFLPEPAHPLYLPLLGELIRIDLERSWSQGPGRRLAHYAARYPVILEQPVLLGAVAFEEYRQRRRAGHNVRAAEYGEAFALDTTSWPEVPIPAERSSEREAIRPRARRTTPSQTPPPTGLAGLGRPEDWRTGRVSVHPINRAPDESGSALLSGWQEAASSLPEPGTAFLGFHLEEELGRGAFGRVYLARQGDLAGRRVALKVACDITEESQTLAQLQHTNIVPIYSYHRSGPLQAVCMPFFGRTTLAHVLRQINNRPALPSSGKELRSTLNVARSETSRRGTSRPAPGEPATATPAPIESPVPAQSARTESLDGWARLEGLSYIEAILTLGSQLADGLSHAHRHGILHRDLKPANVLLTDDGRPMLLDFNLAEDTKQRSAERASIGGTLPYMGPEHIEAYRTGTGRLDERCDIFSLGVILFELLTGRHPFPIYKVPAPDTVVMMVADRRMAPPFLRVHNPAVSPAVEAIIRKCLAPDPADRYQSAADLREDIDRHLNDLPLRHAGNPSRRERLHKWMRRHPRLASSSTVAAVATVLLVAVVAAGFYARERTRGLEARGRFAEHQVAFGNAQLFFDDRNQSWPRLDEGVQQLRSVLARYGVPDDPAAGDEWLSSSVLRYLPESERARVKDDIGETFYLMAQAASLQALGSADAGERTRQSARAARWNELAARYGAGRLPRALREQQAVIASLGGKSAEAGRLHREAEAVPLTSPRDFFLVGSLLARQNRHREALPYLEQATRLDPANFSAWFQRGSSHRALDQNEFAVMCFNACVSLRPDFAPAWTNRGLAFLGLRFRPLAIKDFDRAIELDAKRTETYLYRAEARQAEGDMAGAEEDYTRAINTGNAPTRTYFLRASLRHRRGNTEAEKADRAAGFRVRPADELSWIAWAEQSLEKDAKAALGYVDEALKLNPMSIPGHQLKAHILAERLHRPDDALAVLNRAVELNPDHVPTRAGRGVVLARAGKRDEALRDATAALRLDTRAPNLYQVACIYALTSRTHPEDKREAFSLLWRGLRTGFGLDIVHTDSDLDPLRQDKEFQAIVKDAETLRGIRSNPGGPKK